jgi:GntR family transcriptional repressor for pyruvate dehydrogenase complex
MTKKKAAPAPSARRALGGGSPATGDGRLRELIPAVEPVERRRTLRRTAKTSERIASDIVADIVARGLTAGDRLPTETAMLGTFEVGRASLREALRILEVNGLITIKPGPRGGPVVGELDPADLGRTLSFFFHLGRASFRELVEARLILEPVMARLAATSDDADLKSRLEGVLDREASAGLEDPEYIASANDFHYTVAGMSGNRVLDLIGRALKDLFTDRVSDRGLFPPDQRPAVRREHRQIGNAILSGNAKRAETLMHKHMLEYVRFVELRQPALLDEIVSWG